MAESAVRPRLEEGAFAALWAFAGFTVLSIALQNLFFVALALGLAAAWSSGRWQAWRVSGALLWALPFLLLALVASLRSENQAHSLETWRKWLLLAALWGVPALVDSERRLMAMLGALLFFSALWSLGASALALAGPLGALAHGEAWASVLGRWADTGEWRAVSGSGGYMVLGTGSMLLLALFGALALEDPRWRKPLPLLCMLSLALALLLTQTRGAWLGAALAVVGLLLLRWPKGLWLAAALGLFALAWPQSPVRQRLAQSMDMSQDSTRERVYMGEAGLAIIGDHPWGGVGDAMETWDGHPGFYRRYMPAAAKVWDTTRDQEHGHLHDDWIQIAAMYGVPALLALLLICARLAWSAWALTRSSATLLRGLGWGLLAVQTAWWLNGTFEYNFGSFQSSFTLWLCLGLGLAGERLAQAGLR